MFTWGQASVGPEPSGLGHLDLEDKLVPTLVSPHLLIGGFNDARIGRCRKLPRLHELAFAMGTHWRLGAGAGGEPDGAAGGSRGKSRRLDKKEPAKVGRGGAGSGTGCAFVGMVTELVEQIVKTCWEWPEGRAGEVDGVVRLLGGGKGKGA